MEDHLPALVDAVIADPDLLPETMVEDRYCVLNDRFAQQLGALQTEIKALQADMTQWQLKCCELLYDCVPVREIAKKTRKAQRIICAFSDTPLCKRYIGLLNHRDLLHDGPNEAQRKHMLWRIAVDNERDNPKEARGAIAELNRMMEPKSSGAGQPLQIVINNAVMPRGPLDG